MRILAFDCAGDQLSVTLGEGDRVLARCIRSGRRGHAEYLVPALQRVLDMAGLRANQLGRIAVTIGPGSFTGIRVGLAAAHGLVLAAGVPAVGFSTLEVAAAMAEGDMERGGVLAVVESGLEGLFAQAFTIGPSGSVPLAGSAAGVVTRTTIAARIPDLRRGEPATARLAGSGQLPAVVRLAGSGRLRASAWLAAAGIHAQGRGEWGSVADTLWRLAGRREPEARLTPVYVAGDDRWAVETDRS